MIHLEVLRSSSKPPQPPALHPQQPQHEFLNLRWVFRAFGGDNAVPKSLFILGSRSMITLRW